MVICDHYNSGKIQSNPTRIVLDPGLGDDRIWSLDLCDQCFKILVIGLEAYMNKFTQAPISGVRPQEKRP